VPKASRLRVPLGPLPEVLRPFDVLRRRYPPAPRLFSDPVPRPGHCAFDRPCGKSSARSARAGFGSPLRASRSSPARLVPSWRRPWDFCLQRLEAYRAGHLSVGLALLSLGHGQQRRISRSVTVPSRGLPCVQTWSSALPKPHKAWVLKRFRHRWCVRDRFRKTDHWRRDLHVRTGPPKRRRCRSDGGLTEAGRVARTTRRRFRPRALGFKGWSPGRSLTVRGGVSRWPGVNTSPGFLPSRV